MSNLSVNNNLNNNYSQSFQKKRKRIIIDRIPKDKMNRIYRSQGFLGRLFDKLQGVTGIGLSRKKLSSQAKSMNAKEFDKNLNKYYDQQKNETEIALDVMTGVSAATGYKLVKKGLTYSHLYSKGNKKYEMIGTLAGLGFGAIWGMIAKPTLKLINRLGTPKNERRQERTILKDMGSGLVDGAIAPIGYAYKAGLAASVGINSLSRYVFNKKANKDSNFMDHLSNGWLIKLPALGLAGLSVFKFHKGVDKIEKAIIKSKENVKNIQVFKGKLPLTELADLGKSNLKDKKTQEDLLLATKKGIFGKIHMGVSNFVRKFLIPKKYRKQADIVEISARPLKRTVLESKDLIKEQEMIGVMKELEQYNIFYPKMIQSMPSNIESLIKVMGDGKDPIKTMFDKLNADKVKKEGNWFKRQLYKFGIRKAEYLSTNGVKVINDFLNNYKSSCPASRTAQEAQKYVADTYGKRFTIKGDKPLGVGTIAETFLAKDNETGKDVVIKMVKKWVSQDKLKNDKQKMLDSLYRVRKHMKSDDYEYQTKLVNELYNAWTKEIDLKAEAEAAVMLGKYAVNYNTVAPVAVKNNIFVMEKAKGVQFDKLADYMKKNNIKISQAEAEDLVRNYVQVFFEQLLSVPKKGQKVMHADPHAGNIFVDLNNKKKPFTFIDTGNVMRYTPEEAIQNVTSHIDYLIGNSKSIAKRLLKGAILPAGMSEKQAVDMLSKHLNETFYSGKNRICSDPFSTINNESIEFMKKNKVILNSQNTNFVKAELTYLMNMISVSGIKNQIDHSIKTNDIEQQEKMKLMGKQILYSIRDSIMNNKTCTAKELYARYKYLKDNPETFITTLYTYIPPTI